MILMTILTAALVLLIFAVVVVALQKISAVLLAIGGTPTSLLAKLGMGLRTIESQTSHLTPPVVQINQGLSQVAAGLTAVDRHLARSLTAAGKQGR